MKKKMSLFLAAVMGASLMATGCSSGDSGSQSTSAGADQTAQAGEGEAKKSDPIKIMAPLLGDTSPRNNGPIETALEELTGYEVEVTWVPNSSYTDKVSVVLAGGDLPDILVTTGKDTNIISAVDDGVFWQLDDYIPQFENLSKINPDVQLNASFNGETYGIYRSRDVMRAGVIIRRDWLNNLGLEAPKTADEFTEMLRAFKNNDPDGNGQDDTYGLIIPKWDGKNNFGPFDQIATWFGAPNAYTVDESGNVIPDFLTDEYNEALDYMKGLYAEGLINQDFAVLSTDDWNNDFVNGKAGVIIDMQSRGMSLSSLLAEKNGRDDADGSEWVTMIANVATDNGDYVLPTSGYSGMLMIPNSSVDTEDRLMEVLDFIDKMNTDEGIMLVNKGIEGINYEYDANGNYKDLKIEDETERAQLKADLAGFSQIGTGVTGYKLPAQLKGHQVESERIEIRDSAEVQAKAVFNEVESLISDVQTLKGATLNTIIADARILYVAGQIDRAAYDAEIERWRTSGGNDLLEEMTNLYKENILNK